jgi:hypothetical protein
VTDGGKAEATAEPCSQLLVSERVPEPEVEGGENKDNANVYDQPRPQVKSEEQNINSDYDAYKRKHVDHDGYVSLHVPIVLGSPPERRLDVLNSVTDGLVASV